MGGRIVAVSVMLLFVAFIGSFIWAGLRGVQPAAATDPTRPAATIAQDLPEGRIEADLFRTGALGYRVEIRFAPRSGAAEVAPPSLTFAMVDMAMGTLRPPVEAAGSGAWRAEAGLPMAGRWNMAVGVGDSRAETEFVAD